MDTICRELLSKIGENPLRIGLLDTPARMKKMYKEFFVGYDPEKLPNLTVFPNGEDGIFYDEMIRDTGYFYSFCEHHFLPFFGEYYFGYIPDKWIIGASKIARTVDYFAGKLQVQERLGHEIVGHITKAISPKGCILVLNARHLCKEMRGIKKHNSPFETINVTGLFLKNDGGCKDEFIERISKG